MRAAFGLLTALPLSWDAEDVGGSWQWTPLVGVVIGVAWLVFHQAFIRIGGPFVAAAGTLLVHQALTGARPLRGLAGVVEAVVGAPGEAGPRARPTTTGAATSAVTLVLLVMIAFTIVLDLAPAVLVIVPLVGRMAQVLLLADDDVGVGIPAPSPAQRGLVVAGGLAALAVPPVLATLVRPVRLDVTVLEYFVAGVGALVGAVIVTAGARAWLRARLGVLGSDGWHALGAVADLTALAVVVNRIT